MLTSNKATPLATFEVAKLQVKWAKQTFWAFPLREALPKQQWVALIAVDPFMAVGKYPLQVLDASGKVLASTTLTVQSTPFKTQAISVSKQTAGLQPQAGELEAVGRLKKLNTPVRYWTLPLNAIAPVPQCMNSPFGVKRVVNGVFSGNYHKGIDQKAPQGQVIQAPQAGKVYLARKFQLHGGTVGLDHGQGLSSIYIHMSQILVKEGSVVKQGQAIGKVGATGFAAGPHLHWGVFVQGVSVDPRQWVPSIVACG